jgi:phosphatidylinositol glycan class V
VPQFILALLALTTYHVQIITRISSGYPVWYWWLALMMADHYELQLFGQKWNTSRLAVRWMVLYAMIQGGLFSSFLPPA